MQTRTIISILLIPALSAPLQVVGVAAQASSAEAAIVQFQRAADTYAFTHRQTERRGASPARMTEGAIVTPMVAVVFRDRIQAALRKPGCAPPTRAEADFSVPRVNESSQSSAALPSCIASALPRLPAELEYRAAGVAMVLADAHLRIVVDVLHGAFP